jgi:transposase
VYMSQLLRLGEITAVTVSAVEQEAARDLARAREDCRGDLMREASGLETVAAPWGRLHRWGGLDEAHHAWLARQYLHTPATRAVVTYV